MDLLHYIKRKPLVSDKWHQVKSIMSTHLMGKPPELIYRTRRPLESSNDYALAYRLENFQPITKQSFVTAVNAIIETANHIQVGIEGVDRNTAEFLTSYTIKASGKNYNLRDYVVNHIGKMAEHDCNAVLVVYPIHPTLELIPDFREEIPSFESVQNQFIDIGIELVSSDFINYVDDNDLLYEVGEWVYHVDDKQSYTKPYYYHLTREKTSLVIPYKKGNSVDYKEVDYYFNDLENPPFQVIGHNSVYEDIDGVIDQYYESSYSGAVAIGNRVLGVESDSQIVDTRFTYPEKYMHMERCSYPGCIQDQNPESPYKGLFVNYTVEDNGDSSCTVCKGCGGSGQVAPDTSPLGTHFVAKSDLWDEHGKFTPLIGFVTPPLESPEYLDAKWRKDLVEMDAKLFLTKQNMTNQSGESKSYDVKQKVTVLTAAATNIWMLFGGLLNSVQGYLRGEENIQVILPKDFHIKSSQDLTQELEQSQGTPSAYTSTLARELLLTKMGNTDEAVKMVDFLEQHDKLFGYNLDQILKAKAIFGNDLTSRDLVVHDKGLSILKSLKGEDFLRLSDDQLLQRFNERINRLLGLEEVEITDDPLAQLEREARSKLKGTVGGVQGLISINQAVGEGVMSEAAAELLLVQVYGFPADVAQRLIEPTQAIQAPGAIA